VLDIVLYWPLLTVFYLLLVQLDLGADILITVVPLPIVQKTLSLARGLDHHSALKPGHSNLVGSDMVKLSSPPFFCYYNRLAIDTLFLNFFVETGTRSLCSGLKPASW
jgi:hypothetical protein